MADSTTTGVSPGLVLTSPTVRAFPVQDESAAGGLCGAELPDGTAILMWPYAGDAHYALVSSVADFLIDDVVPAADIQAVGAAGGVVRTSVWVIANTDLYCTVRTENAGGLREILVYKADSATNPTTWTLHGTVTSNTGSGGVVFTSSLTAPLPHVMAGGRWVMVGALPVSPGYDANDVGSWYSDDAGATWTLGLQFAFSGFHDLYFVASQFAPQANGKLIFTAAGGGADPIRMWESSDGAAWTNTGTGPFTTDPHLTTYVYNGTTTYALGSIWDLRDSPIYEYDGAGGLFADFTDTGFDWSLGDSIGNHENNTRKAVITTNYIFYFWIDRVTSIPTSPPVPAFYPPLLHIPHKDRLGNLELDDDGQPTAESLRLAASRDSDNLKTIDRWARAFMAVSRSAARCTLFIPHLEYMTTTRLPITRDTLVAWSSAAFQNFKEIQQWADRIARGECGCYCTAPPTTPPPARCQLHIPFPDALANLELDDNGGLLTSGLKAAAAGEFEAYKAIERWGNRYHSGECICQCT